MAKNRESRKGVYFSDAEDADEDDVSGNDEDGRGRDDRQTCSRCAQSGQTSRQIVSDTGATKEEEEKKRVHKYEEPSNGES